MVASDVFEETDFPSMSYGRVALLGDGMYLYTPPLPLKHLIWRSMAYGTARIVRAEDNLADISAPFLTEFAFLGTMTP